MDESFSCNTDPAAGQESDEEVVASPLPVSRSAAWGTGRPMVSLLTASALTGISSRTLRRWIKGGTVPGNDSEGPAAVLLDAIVPYISGVRLEPGDLERVAEADRGDAEAENDLALLLLEARDYPRALYWLNRAADKGHADAMHWLGRCHLEGLGVQRDGDLGIMWLAKSAACGHALSRTQMNRLLQRHAA